MNKMVWDDKQSKFVDVVAEKKGKSFEKIALDANLANALKGYAKADGFVFEGVRFVTEKTADGKTKQDKAGKPIFVMENGKPKKTTVPESTARVNSAISQYVEIAVRKLIAEREEASKEAE